MVTVCKCRVPLIPMFESSEDESSEDEFFCCSKLGSGNEPLFSSVISASDSLNNAGEYISELPVILLRSSIYIFRTRES